MDRNFAASLSHVLKHEGGFVNHPNDPGGPTNKGITLATFKRYVKRNATVTDLKNLTIDQAGIVYRKQYWDRVKGDDLPSGVDYAVFDFAVNSGPARAAKYLQAVVGVTQDGKIGPKTLAAVKRADPQTVIERLCDDRLAFLKRLKTWPTFGRGWSRRIEEVRNGSVLLADTQPAGQVETPSPAPKAPETPSTRPTGRKIGPVALLILLASTAVAALAGVGQWIGDFFTKLFGL